VTMEPLLQNAIQVLVAALSGIVLWLAKKMLDKLDDLTKSFADLKADHAVMREDIRGTKLELQNVQGQLRVQARDVADLDKRMSLAEERLGRRRADS
jgi:hypothetical protein